MLFCGLKVAMSAGLRLGVCRFTYNPWHRQGGGRNGVLHEPAPGAFMGVIEKHLGDDLDRHDRPRQFQAAGQHLGDNQRVGRGQHPLD